MNPSDRIGFIYANFPPKDYPEEDLEDWIRAIIQYLDEEYEKEQDKWKRMVQVNNENQNGPKTNTTTR